MASFKIFDFEVRWDDTAEFERKLLEPYQDTMKDTPQPEAKEEKEGGEDSQMTMVQTDSEAEAQEDRLLEEQQLTEEERESLYAWLAKFE